MATKLISPSFAPSLHSQSIYSDHLRNPSFIAGGIALLVHLTNNIHLKLGNYHFLPYEPIELANNQLVVKKQEFGIAQTFFFWICVFYQSGSKYFSQLKLLSLEPK